MRMVPSQPFLSPPLHPEPGIPSGMGAQQPLLPLTGVSQHLPPPSLPPARFTLRPVHPKGQVSPLEPWDFPDCWPQGHSIFLEEETALGCHLARMRTVRTRGFPWLQLVSSVLTCSVKITGVRGEGSWYLSTACRIRARSRKEKPGMISCRGKEVEESSLHAHPTSSPEQRHSYRRGPAPGTALGSPAALPAAPGAVSGG